MPRRNRGMLSSKKYRYSQRVDHKRIAQQRKVLAEKLLPSACNPVSPSNESISTSPKTNNLASLESSKYDQQAIIIHNLGELKNCKINININIVKSSCDETVKEEALLHVSAFVDGLSEHCLTCTVAQCLCGSLKALNTSLQNYRRVDPKSFIQATKDFIPNLFDGHQQDAHELILKVLEVLTQNEKIPFPLRSVFEFQVTHSLTCITCVTCRESKKIPEYVIEARPYKIIENEDGVSTAVSFERVQDCLNFFFQKHIATVLCDLCKKNTDHDMCVRALSTPRALFLHIRRFPPNGEKDTTPIVIDRNLYMNNTTYSLISAVVHSGSSVYDGHYTSVCSWLKKETQQWTLFNDDVVVDKSPQYLSDKDIMGGVYVLMYGKVGDALPKPQTMQSPPAVIPGRPCQSQFQDAIVRAFNHYFGKSNKNDSDFKQAVNQCSSLYGVCDKTVVKYVNKFKRGSPFKTPGKTRPNRKKPSAQVDDFTKGAIRRLIYNLHRKRRHFNLKELLDHIKENEIEFNWSRESLRRVLHKMGFRFKKKDGRRYLMELPYVVKRRIRFVEAYHEKVFKQGKTPIFSDETWVHSRGRMTGKEWTDGRSECGSIRRASAGRRYIVLGSGGAAGWVPGASRVFPADSNDGDYHKNMNADNFEHYLKNELVPNLTSDSVIVMDGATYHRRQVPGQPKASWSMKEAKEWLEARQINCEGKGKEEVVKLALTHRGPLKLVVQEWLKHQPLQHEILYLPPYHPHLNAIEYIWALAKLQYDKIVGLNTVKFDEKNTISSWHKALDGIQPSAWKNCVSKSEKIIKHVYETECALDVTNYEQFHINLEDSDLSDQEFCGDNEVEDDDEEAVDNPQIVPPSEDIGSPEMPQKTSRRCLLLSELSSIELCYHHLVLQNVDVYLASLNLMDSVVFAFNITLTGRDLKSLLPDNCLFDNVIDFYLQVVAKHRAERECSVYAHTIDFYHSLSRGGYQSVLHWTKKVDIFSNAYIIFPILIHGHYVITIVDMRKKSVTYYDSLHGENKKCLRLLMSYLKNECNQKRGHAFPVEGWSLSHSKDMPKQDNAVDCGVMVCAAADHVTRNVPLLFSCHDAPRLRQQMVVDIVAKKLCNDPPVIPTLDQHAAVDWPANSVKHCRFKKTLALPKPATLNESPPASCLNLTTEEIPRKKLKVISGNVPTVAPYRSSASIQSMCLPTCFDGVVLRQSASLHIRDNRFPAERRDLQGSAVCAVAVAAMCAFNGRLTRAQMDGVILKGDSIYEEHSFALQVDWIDAVSHLMKNFRFSEIEFFVGTSVCGKGHLNDSSRNSVISKCIGTEVSSFQHLSKGLGFIFVAFNRFVSFTLTPEDNCRFNFFTPYCVDSNNKLVKISKKGAARLFRCSSSAALTSLLLYDRPHEKEEWVLLRMSVDWD